MLVAGLEIFAPACFLTGHYFDGFGLSKSEMGGCISLTHHLGGDFEHGKITRPVPETEDPSLTLPAGINLKGQLPGIGALHKVEPRTNLLFSLLLR